MMKRMKKWMLLAGIFCMVSLCTYGCGDGKKSADSSQSEDLKEDEDDDTVEPQDEKDPAEASPEGEPSLYGEIKELGGKEFTVVESKTWEEEDGSTVAVSPGSGDDSDFNKVRVSYDENTVFTLRTIYDGGERYEDAKASENDLSEGVSVNVWCDSLYSEESGGAVYAEEIQIVKVVF